MSKNLPSRPDLDHLRRQAKALLASLEAGDAEAISTIAKHLPSAAKLSENQIRKSTFRLADAQSAIARKTGFASWPNLARHVEQLRALEGTWAFSSLELDGRNLPPGMIANSQILIDGDRFRTESLEATYEGVFNINVETEPHEIDIEFVAGPEAGNWNFGIFRFDGNQLEICLDLNGKPRPKDFTTRQGSGHAFERLIRASESRPFNVTGGARPETKPTESTSSDELEFKFSESEALTRLQGDWRAVKIVHNGQSLPGAMLKSSVRSAHKNEVRVTVAGQLMIHALVRINESVTPIAIDYYSLQPRAKGMIQLGIMQWDGKEASFCMAPVGEPRPTNFSCIAGSGHTLSQWKLKS